MTDKKVSKRVLESMLNFFEKLDMVPMEAKRALEDAYQSSNTYHYSSGCLNSNNYSWYIDALKELIARKDRETNRVKKSVRASGVNKRFF